MRSIFNDRHSELVEVTEHSPFASTLWDTFDLFDHFNLEALVFELFAVLSRISLY